MIFYYLDNGDALGPPLPTDETEKARQVGDDKYDDDDGDASLTYFNFTAVLNPDDPLFEDEQQVCRTAVS